MLEKDGKYIFGTVKVGEKGQIVIPKEARDHYNIKSNDSLIILGDEKGIAVLKSDLFLELAKMILDNKMDGEK